MNDPEFEPDWDKLEDDLSVAQEWVPEMRTCLVCGRFCVADKCLECECAE